MWDWAWALQDASGANLSLLTGARARYVDWTRSSTPEAYFELDLEHDDAYAVRAALGLGVPRLRAFRIEPDLEAGQLAVCRFGGLVLPVEEDAASGLMKVTARGVFEVLEGRFTDELFARDVTPAGDIAVELFELTETIDGPTGMRIGNVDFTTPRDVTHEERKNIADAWAELADAFDYEVVPLSDDTGQGFELGELNIYGRQGVVRDGAAFGYGDETVGNCSGANRQTLRPRNRVIVTGDEGTYAIAEDPASIDRYGVWTHVESMSDVLDESMLQARADELVQGNLDTVVSFTPDPAKVNDDGEPLTPIPGVDYWLGDSVPLTVRKGAFESDGYVRVDGIRVDIDDDGFEAAHTVRIGDAEGGA